MSKLKGKKRNIKTINEKANNPKAKFKKNTWRKTDDKESKVERNKSLKNNNNNKKKKVNNALLRAREKKNEDNSDFEEIEEDISLHQNAEVQEDSDVDDDQETSDVRKLVAQQNRKKKKSGGFQSMGLSHNVFKGISRKGYKIPTPIQRKTIPVIMDGKDVVAMARTGSGKTAAFLIPMFECLKTHSAKSGARALIMSPTRELALQTLKFAKEIGKFTGLRAAVVLGGDRMEDQFTALHSNPDIIIATPGRFMHVAVEMDLKLRSVQYVVFDEADRLFEMGFQEQLNEILNRLPESRQTLLFSATLPKLLVDFAKAGLHDPTLIRLDVDTKLSDQLKLSFLQCRADDKPSVLVHLLKHVIQSGEQSVVFAATKHHVEYINLVLQKAEIPCTFIYSSLDPTARKINLAKFQHRKVLVMIVTDLAARGIDIPLLDNVINYHFPAKAKLFVHRVGRVARAGRSGVAYSLVAPDEAAHVVDLHVFLGRPLKFVHIGKQTKDEDGLYGTVPQSVIDDLAETVRAWHEENYDINSMIKVCSNAYGLYIRSRPAAAPESIKRIKEMDKTGQHIGVHPIFGVAENSGEEERLKLLNALKSYKANATVFEINTTAKNSSFSVMKKKRNMHDKVVQSKLRSMEDFQLETNGNGDEKSGTESQEKLHESELKDAFSVVIGGKKASTSQVGPSESSSQTSKKRKRCKEPVRDEEYYISYRPSDYQTEQGLRLGSSFDREASGALLDMAGDDTEIARKKLNALKWDRKKKKFVRESNEDPKKKKIRTESGAWIPASYKSNAYKDWVQKSKTDTQVDKDDDDNEESDLAQEQNRPKNQLDVLGVTQYNRRHVKGTEGGYQGNKREKFKRKGSELKRPEQIVKARKIKAKKQAFQNQRQNKNKMNQAKHRHKK